MITLRFYRDMFDKVEWDYYNNLADAANNTNTAEPITNTVDHQKKNKKRVRKTKSNSQQPPQKKQNTNDIDENDMDDETLLAKVAPTGRVLELSTATSTRQTRKSSRIATKSITSQVATKTSLNNAKRNPIAADTTNNADTTTNSSDDDSDDPQEAELPDNDSSSDESNESDYKVDNNNKRKRKPISSPKPQTSRVPFNESCAPPQYPINLASDWKWYNYDIWNDPGTISTISSEFLVHWAPLQSANKIKSAKQHKTYIEKIAKDQYKQNKKDNVYLRWLLGPGLIFNKKYDIIDQDHTAGFMSRNLKIKNQSDKRQFPHGVFISFKINAFAFSYITNAIQDATAKRSAQSIGEE